MKIGNIEIGNTVLAPMAGVTDLAFRLICKKMRVGLTVTEMVSAKGLYYKDKGTKRLTVIEKAERPVSLQIFGSDPDVLREVIKNDLNHRDEIDMIDINMGCPVPKIVKNGDGSALMKDPKLISKILEQCVRVSKKPLTIKIRSGWDKNTINAVEISKIAENCGVDAITIHGRTRDMYYSGQADWDIIREIKSRVGIPIIGNGDIFKPHDALEMIDYTGCEAVAIGRGAMGNPFLFKGINSLLDGNVSYEPTNDEILEMVLYHLRLSCKLKGEKIAIREMRKHIAWYLKGLRDSNEIKNKINIMEDRKEIERTIDEYFYNLKK